MENAEKTESLQTLTTDQMTSLQVKKGVMESVLSVMPPNNRRKRMLKAYKGFLQSTSIEAADIFFTEFNSLFAEEQAARRNKERNKSK